MSQNHIIDVNSELKSPLIISTFSMCHQIKDRSNNTEGTKLHTLNHIVLLPELYWVGYSLTQHAQKDLNVGNILHLSTNGLIS